MFALLFFHNTNISLKDKKRLLFFLPMFTLKVDIDNNKFLEEKIYMSEFNSKTC